MDQSDVTGCIEKLWKKYPDATCVTPSVLAKMILGMTGELPTDLKVAETEALVLAVVAASPTMVRVLRGRHAGIYRKVSDVPAGIAPGLVVYPGGNPYRAEAAVSVVETPTVAINNHTCPSCRNDRCSKGEKSCWKCGNPL